MSWLSAASFDSALLFLAFPADAASLAAGMATDWAASEEAHSASATTSLSKNFAADAIELVEETWKSTKRDLVWTI